MSIKARILRTRKWVEFIDDERNVGNGIIVTLAEGYYFKLDPGCGVRGYESMGEVADETRKCDVYFNSDPTHGVTKGMEGV